MVPGRDDACDGDVPRRLLPASRKTCAGRGKTRAGGEGGRVFAGG